MSEKQEKPAILARNVVARSRLFEIEQVHLQFSNQEKRIFERMSGSSRGAVMIVPVLDEKTLLLASEYAAGTHRYELGFPKGLIDKGETASAAANRELQEELGYGAHKLTYLKTLALAPGFLDSNIEVFLAQDLYPNKLAGDEPEPIQTIPWALSQWQQLLEEENITDARSVAALFLAIKALS